MNPIIVRAAGAIFRVFNVKFKKFSPAAGIFYSIFPLLHIFVGIFLQNTYLLKTYVTNQCLHIIQWFMLQ